MRRADILDRLLQAVQEESGAVPELAAKRDLLETTINFIEVSVEKLGEDPTEDQIFEFIVYLRVLRMSLSVLPSIEATIADSVVKRLDQHLHEFLEEKRKESVLEPEPVEDDIEVVEGEVMDITDTTPVVPDIEIEDEELSGPPIVPEVITPPEREPIADRNDYERFLAANFVPLEDLDPTLPEGLDYDEQVRRHKERYQKLRSYFHSILIRMAQGDIVARSLSLPDITQLSLRVERGTTSTPYVPFNLFKQMSMSLNGAERAAALAVQSEVEMDMQMQMVALRHNQKMEKTFSHDGIHEVYNPTAESGPGSYNIWFWNALTNLPRLANYIEETGEWVFDKESMGEKIFKSLQEVLRRGRRLHPDDLIPPGAPPDRELGVLAELKNVPHDLLVAMRHEHGHHWVKKRMRYKSISKHAALPLRIPGFPRGEEKLNILFEISRYREEGDPDKHKTGTWSTLLAYVLTDIFLEASYEDSVGGKEYGELMGGVMALVGTTTGIRELERLMNPDKYAYKGLIDQDFQGAAYNTGFINTVKSFFFTFLDYYGYDGKTYTEHIIACKDFEDFKKIQWDRLPSDATAKWYKSIDDALTVAKVCKDGFKGNLRSAGKADLESLEVSNINIDFLKEIKKIYRVLDAYVVTRDTGTKAAMKEGGAKNTTDEENPTGQYIRIQVTDPNGNVIHTLDTRAHQLFHIDPQSLRRWVEGDLGIEGGLNGTTSTGAPVLEIRTKPRKISGDKLHRLNDLSRRRASLTDSEKTELKGLQALAYPEPKDLLMRELMYRIFYMTNGEGDIIKDLKKEDIVIFGMFVCAEVRELFRKRALQGPVGDALNAVIELAGSPRALMPELPRMDPVNIYPTFGEYLKFLKYMGYEYRIEDLLHAGNELLAKAKH